MASPNIYPNGLNLAGTVFQNGPETLQLDGPTYLAGGIQWVDTISGSNVNAGTLPELPVQTLAQAVTNSAANGTIVIGEGSAESLAGSQTLNLAGLSIFGCGTGTSRPRYTCATGGAVMLSITATTWIEGFYFPASTAVPITRIDIAGASCVIKDCYFECGANDTTQTLRISASGANCRVEGCSLVVTASRPGIGMSIAAAVADTTVVDTNFDGGSYGWADYALKVLAAATRITYSNLTFTNRSDLGHTVTATTYKIFGLDMGGTGNVLLTA